jgi:hypothetical protein
MFEVDEATVNRWKLEYPDFCESLKRGKEEADAIVAQKLFHRATGYDCKATKFATHEGRITDSEEYIEHYPPDTTAAIFWLKNRQSKKWRDKIEQEITGPGGGPLLVAALSDEELDRKLIELSGENE